MPPVAPWREARRERLEKIEYAAGRLAVFDMRSQDEFVSGVAGEGDGGVSRVSPRAGRGSGAATVLPLGGISNVTTVCGNESGEFLVYRSDEHGFHNPPGLWALEKLDAALVGDAFAQGASVPSPSNLAAMIRLRYPATLNLGHAGNGPLSELGSILEYLPGRRPRVVLWAFSVESDLTEDLEREKTLRGTAWVSGAPAAAAGARAAAGGDRRRAAGAGARARGAGGGRAEPDFKTFAEVLETARDAVAGWGGRLVFVYLPARTEGRSIGAQTLEVCRRLGLPVLDIERRFAGRRSAFDDYFYDHAGTIRRRGTGGRGR